MATTLQIIEDALREIRVLAGAEEATPDDVQDALRKANQMIDSWANEGLLVPALTHESFSIDPAQIQYTIGTGGDFDTDRPIEIINARNRDSGGLETPIKIAAVNTWAEIELKDTEIYSPAYLYYEPSYPLGIIHFSSIPILYDTLKLITRKEVTALPALTTETTYPPGYEALIVLALAIELADGYGKQITAGQAARHRRNWAGVKRTNSKTRLMDAKVDSALIRTTGYDITHGPV